MSENRDQLREMAERVARRLAQPQLEPQANAGELAQLADLKASLLDIQRRLSHIESHIKHDDCVEEAGAHQLYSQQKSSPEGPATRSPWLSGMYVPATNHPSLERFDVNEAAVAELVDFLESEKKCELEPGGKPCDHCAMCSSRGF
jgi:hypothetical protein